MDYIAALLERIDWLLNGDLSVLEFREQYYDFYLEQVPDESLSDRDAQFFGAVQEKLDWTDENPDSESRSDGWMNHNEYIEWVRDYRQSYLSGQSIFFTI